ncbi:MAG: hypothetical protein WBA92_01070 [Pseudorhodobacter sp.]
MTQHTIETVTFTLNAGVSREAFAREAKSISDFVRNRDGFIARRLSVGDDGLWIEHIEWASLAAAKSAAADICNDPTLAAAMGMIDGPSVKLYHTTLEIAVD